MSISDNIKNWLKNPYNLLLVALIIFVLAIRIYYFSLTKSQPLWWDEAEYMLKAKNIAFNLPDTGWWSGRPILFSLISALFFKIGLGEIGLRFVIALLSVGGIALVYLIGKEITNEKIAILGAFIYSFIYLDLFYSTRLLVNIPELFLGLLIFYLFYKSISGKPKLAYFIIPVFILGFFLRYTIGIYLIVCALTFLFYFSFSKLKSKRYYLPILIIIGLGIIYLIYSFATGNNILSSFLEAFKGALTRDPSISIGSVFSQYFKLIPSAIGIAFFIAFLIGLIYYFASFIIGIDKFIKKPLEDFSKKRIFSFFWLIIPFFVYGTMINHFEDRYIMMIFPIIAIFASQGLFFVYDYIKKYSKAIGIIIIIGIVGFGCYSLTMQSNSIIKSRLTSYGDIKSAGEWIKQNSNPSDIILSSSTPQITYYSERADHGISHNISVFEQEIKESKPKFLVLSIFEQPPEWIDEWVQVNQENLTPVKVYYIDANQPSLVIYQFK